jgi:hypothetical protein
VGRRAEELGGVEDVFFLLHVWNGGCCLMMDGRVVDG